MLNYEVGGGCGKTETIEYGREEACKSILDLRAVNIFNSDNRFQNYSEVSQGAERVTETTRYHAKSVACARGNFDP